MPRARTTFSESRRRNGDQHVARLGQGGELVDEDVVVGQVVGDGGDQFHVGAERMDVGPHLGVGLDALQVVADQVIGDRRRTAVAAGEDAAWRP